MHTAQVAEGESRDWENEEPYAGADQAWEHLSNLNMHKSMGPDKMHLRVLRELAKKVAKLLSIIVEESRWFDEVPIDFKRGKYKPDFKKAIRTHEK